MPPPMRMESDPNAPHAEPSPVSEEQSPVVDPSVAAAFAALQQKLGKKKEGGDPLEDPNVIREAAEAIQKEEQKIAEHPPKLSGDR